MPTDFLSVLREFHDRDPTVDLFVNHPMDFQAVNRTVADLPPVSFGAWSRSLVRAATGTPAGDVQAGPTEES